MKRFKTFLEEQRLEENTFKKVAFSQGGEFGVPGVTAATIRRMNQAGRAASNLRTSSPVSNLAGQQLTKQIAKLATQRDKGMGLASGAATPDNILPTLATAGLAAPGAAAASVATRGAAAAARGPVGQALGGALRATRNFMMPKSKIGQAAVTTAVPVTGITRAAQDTISQVKQQIPGTTTMDVLKGGSRAITRSMTGSERTALASAALRSQEARQAAAGVGMEVAAGAAAPVATLATRAPGVYGPAKNVKSAVTSQVAKNAPTFQQLTVPRAAYDAGLPAPNPDATTAAAKLASDISNARNVRLNTQGVQQAEREAKRRAKDAAKAAYQASQPTGNLSGRNMPSNRPMSNQTAILQGSNSRDPRVKARLDHLRRQAQFAHGGGGVQGYLNQPAAKKPAQKGGVLGGLFGGIFGKK